MKLGILAVPGGGGGGGRFDITEPGIRGERLQRYMLPQCRGSRCPIENIQTSKVLRPRGWEPLIYRQSGRGPGKRTPWKSSDQPTRSHVTVKTHTGVSTQYA